MRIQCVWFWSLVVVVKNGMVSRLASGIGLHCEYFHPSVYSLAGAGCLTPAQIPDLPTSVALLTIQAILVSARLSVVICMLHESEQMAPKVALLYGSSSCL